MKGFKNAVSGLVVTAICLGVCRIADKDAFKRVRTHFAIDRDMVKHKSTHTYFVQMRKVRGAAIKGLKWCVVMQGADRATNNEVCGSFDKLIPV